MLGAEPPKEGFWSLISCIALAFAAVPFVMLGGCSFQ